MTVSEIKDAIESAIVARGCFLVDITISKENDIEVTFESEEGIVELQDCIELSRLFEEKFDREKEDYSITMSSAGLDQPFKILKQYQKAIGKKVEVSLKGGKKVVAELTAADENGITIRYSAKEAVEGKKNKELVEHNDTYSFEQVNSVVPYIEFE
jgi:ribosome maturation factor RimP